MKALALLFVSVSSVAAERVFDEQSYDGIFNNLLYPTWGSVGTALNRITIPDFGDGSYLPREREKLPEPRKVSNAIFRKTNTQDRISTSHQRQLTALFVMFGQKLMQEIAETVLPCRPPEYLSIPTKSDDQEFGGITIPMVRSEYLQGSGRAPGRPREILNEVTPYVDLANIYGQNKPWNDALREFEGGRLKIDPSTQLPLQNFPGLPFANPPPPSRHHGQNNFFIPDNRENFLLGNPIGAENPGIWVLHVIWAREHNRRAAELSKTYPNWNDNHIYNRARQFTIALYQNIVFNEWLPLFLNEPNSDTIGTYPGYDVNLHPQISPEFTTVAMRFGHTIVPHGFRRKTVGECGNDNPVRLCNSFFNVREVIDETGPETVEQLITGMASQLTEAGDTLIVEDLQSFLFGGVELNRRDLISLNIQRGRDHGIASYNSLLRALGLPTKNSFNEFTNGSGNVLASLYRNVEDIDAFVGGMLETNTTTGTVGPLFRAIAIDQFRRLRNGDRFYFENKRNGLFNETETNKIKQTSFSEIIRRNMRFDSEFIGDAPAPFVLFNGVPCNLGPLGTDETERCTPAARHSFNQIGQVTVYSIVVILTVLILFASIYIYIARVKNTRVSKVIKRMKFVNSTKGSKGSKGSKGGSTSEHDYLFMFVTRFTNAPDREGKIAELYELFTSRVLSRRGTASAVCNRETFENGFKLLLRNSGITFDPETIKQIVNNLFGVYAKKNSESLTRAEFERMMLEQEFQLSKNSELTSGIDQKRTKYSFKDIILSNRLEFIWVFIYVCAIVFIFAERAFVYRYETENTGFRQVIGNGVVVTRGAASVISFTLALLPLTMSKKFLQWISTTKLSNIIPVNRANYFHKVVGATFAFFTAVHIIGHTSNFYWISSSHPRDMDLIFPEIYFLSNQLPTFWEFWILQTTTGFTGLLLVINVLMLLPFTLDSVRMYSYQLFWKSHQLYIILYILTFLHGSAQLIQAPLFWHYALASVFIYTLDKVYRKKQEFEVTEILHLPSGVIEVRVKKPAKFVYQAGQWGYLSFSKHAIEKHPFTITTAPHEKYISFHVRVVGSWTMKLENYLGSSIYFDGPFGNSYANVGEYKYKTLIFVAGGIGATPFSSILKDTLFKLQLQQNKYDSLGISNITRMYFFWISRTTTSYEWFGDLLNRLEKETPNLSVFRFITGKFENAVSQRGSNEIKGNPLPAPRSSLETTASKEFSAVEPVLFDFQKILLTLGESQHRKLTGGKGLIGGHKYPIYFGRPNWDKILVSIVERAGRENAVSNISGDENENEKQSSVGMFVCGGPNLTRDLQRRCYKLNCDFYYESFS